MRVETDAVFLLVTGSCWTLHVGRFSSVGVFAALFLLWRLYDGGRDAGGVLRLGFPKPPGDASGDDGNEPLGSLIDSSVRACMRLEMPDDTLRARPEDADSCFSAARTDVGEEPRKSDRASRSDASFGEVAALKICTDLAEAIVSSLGRLAWNANAIGDLATVMGFAS